MMDVFVRMEDGRDETIECSKYKKVSERHYIFFNKEMQIIKELTSVKFIETGDTVFLERG